MLASSPVALILLVVAAAAAAPFQDDDPVVSTASGPVRGFRFITPRTRAPFEVYLGIPFAEAPVGSLRFKAPVPIANWSAIRDAQTVAPSCHSTDPILNKSEDCLYLNVYTPDSSGASEPKAVLVFIYGGGFTGGTSDPLLYGPGFLMEQDAVLVTLNYRVGPLGFLSLQDDTAPGNAGLKDQTEALRWIDRNIAFFGGDPDTITCFGQSAGAASVNYHVVSEYSRGLCRRAIQQSGSVINPWAYHPPNKAVEMAESLAKKMNCPEGQLRECLMTASAEDITGNLTDKLTLEDALNMRFFVFLPTTEANHDGAFLTEDPLTSMKEGRFDPNIPVIIGTTSQESLMMFPTLDSADPHGLLSGVFGLNLSIFAPERLHLAETPSLVSVVNRMMSFSYFEDALLSLHNRDQFLNLLSDVQFVEPSQEAAKYFLQFSNKPIYNYLFSYDGKYAFFKYTLQFQHDGVCHGDDLGYLFYSSTLLPIYDHSNSSSIPELTISRMTSMWCNFAKFGNPTPELTSVVPERWDPVTSSDSNYMEIAAEMKPSKCLNCKRTQFWNAVYKFVVNEIPFLE